MGGIGVDRLSRGRPASMSRGDAVAIWVNQFAAGCSWCAKSGEGFEALDGAPSDQITRERRCYPRVFILWMQAFRPHVTGTTWRNLLVLVTGALLEPGKRTVGACLRMTGRADATNL